MSSVWERFESIANTEEVAEAKSRFESPEIGDYVATLESLEATESKEGLPMLKGMFKVVATGKGLFYNQMLQNINYPNMTAVNIADAVTFLSAVKGEEISYTGMSALADEVESIELGKEYIVNVSYGKKDLEQKFPKLKVLGFKEDEPSLPFDAE